MDDIEAKSSFKRIFVALLRCLWDDLLSELASLSWMFRFSCPCLNTAFKHSGSFHLERFFSFFLDSSCPCVFRKLVSEPGACWHSSNRGFADITRRQRGENPVAVATTLLRTFEAFCRNWTGKGCKETLSDEHGRTALIKLEKQQTLTSNIQANRAAFTFPLKETVLFVFSPRADHFH